MCRISWDWREVFTPVHLARVPQIFIEQRRPELASSPTVVQLIHCSVDFLEQGADLIVRSFTLGSLPAPLPIADAE